MYIKNTAFGSAAFILIEWLLEEEIYILLLIVSCWLIFFHLVELSVFFFLPAAIDIVSISINQFFLHDIIKLKKSNKVKSQTNSAASSRGKLNGKYGNVL